MNVPECEEKIFFEKRNKYCLLIPLFNEGERYKNQVKKMQRAGVFNVVDVIICDAGSSDGTTDEEYLKMTGHRALLTRKGIGRQSSDLRMGMHWALQQGYDGIIKVDGNDKDGTEAVPLFISKLDEEYDYIQGSRFIRGGVERNTPLIRKVALKLLNEPIMSFSAHRRLTDTTNGFKAYSKKFLTDERVNPFRECFFGYELEYYLPVRACRLGYKVVEIPVLREYPDNGDVPSKIGGIKGYMYQLSMLHHTIWNHYAPENEYKIKQRRR